LEGIYKMIKVGLSLTFKFPDCYDWIIIMGNADTNCAFICLLTFIAGDYFGKQRLKPSFSYSL